MVNGGIDGNGRSIIRLQMRDLVQVWMVAAIIVGFLIRNEVCHQKLMSEMEAMQGMTVGLHDHQLKHCDLIRDLYASGAGNASAALWSGEK